MIKQLPFCLVLCVILCIEATESTVKDDDKCGCEKIPKDFNSTITGSTNATCTRCYAFSYTFYRDQNWAASVCVESTAPEKSPLMVVVRQSLSIMSWQVPMTFIDDSFPHSEVCHTLCPLSNYLHSDIKNGTSQEIIVEFWSSQSNTFKFQVTYLREFVIGMNQPLTLTLTPSEPRVLQYKMPSDMRSVRIEATSPNKSCMILAIQDIQCPFYDSERTVEHEGFYQTLTRQSAISITRRDFRNGLYVVMILKPNDKDCLGNSDHTIESSAFRMKQVTVQVVPSISDEQYYEAVLGAFGIYVIIYIFSFIVCCFLTVRNRRLTLRETTHVNVESPSIQTYGTSMATSDEESSSGSLNEVSLEPAGQMRRNSSFDETDIDKLPDALSDKNVIRTKTFLFVSDLAKKKEKYLSNRAKVYSWNLLTIAIFYGLPVIQLVYTNQKIVNMTGNQDLCYYNFLCCHKVGAFSDFNHVYSNIGYVMLGILFLLLVYRRESQDCIQDQLNSKIPQNELLGIPQHFGLYYAMGWALIMEGVLSGSYHVCPSKANFQFDTAFMYVIATICMMKLYQARHPDIAAKSHTTWMVLAVVIILGVGGVLQGGVLFWILFVFAHLITTFLVSVTIYYMGRWKLDRHIYKRVILQLKLDIAAHSFRPTYLGRFLMLSVAVLLNIALDLFGLIKMPVNFGAFLLAAFIMNLLLYLIYYTLMKIRYREGIRWIPLMYMVLSFACWGAALHFFLAKNTSWQLTPALSREQNKHCLILNFFDHHDIWHFLSSCALFFSFMVLFTLDDDLQNTPRSKIVVF